MLDSHQHFRFGTNKFKDVLAKLAQLLEVKDILKTQVKKLSLGQRMKCELIAALLHSPKILFLDEPTIGLDVVVQKKLREFIKEYNLRYKSTIILTSHYMKDVQALAKRVIIINSGKILYDGKLENLIKKYAPYKSITIILKKEIDLGKIKHLGQVKSFEYPQVVLNVKSQNSNKVAAEILKDLPVEDLNIEEADIEDVIRQVFGSGK